MALLKGRQAAFFRKTSAGPVAATGVSMTRVGTSMWWKCSDTAKNYWDRANTITVKDGVTPVTPTKIAYAGGYVKLSAVPSGSVTADFYYFTVAQVLGAYGWSIDPEMETEESTRFQSDAKEYAPTVLKWAGSVESFWYPTHSESTMSQGSNKDLRFRAQAGGPGGDNISYQIVVAGNNTPLSVSISGRDITINQSTGVAGAATGTAMQILSALQAEELIRDQIKVYLASGSNGSGIPTAVSHTHLSGGASPTEMAALAAGSELIGVFYTDYTTSKDRFEGIVLLDKLGVKSAVAGLVKETLGFTGYGDLWSHEG
jgi:hypothetical protein